MEPIQQKPDIPTRLYNEELHNLFPATFKTENQDWSSTIGQFQAGLGSITLPVQFLLLYTDYDYPFGIFKLFLLIMFNYRKYSFFFFFFFFFPYRVYSRLSEITLRKAFEVMTST
jgi:hypothetical protein